ncbi:MAG: hypothetical protein ACW967_00075 [Candidatus Hodarchaeales archaeon]
MALIVEDMEKKNWLVCESCSQLCKNPNYDDDLKIDECCLCSFSELKCSVCNDRKVKKKKKEKPIMYF